MFHYRLHGLVIASDEPIGGAPRAHGGNADIAVAFDRARDSGAVGTPLLDGPLFTVFRRRGGYRFDFPDGTQFVIDRDGTSIRASGPPDLVSIYLVNTVMAFVLRLRGHEVLHASCANIDAVAVAFAGPGGAGKSTLAAVLAKRGFSIVSEDVTALIDRGDRFDVLPSHRRIRLWSDAATMLYGDSLPWLAGNDWKRFAELPDAGDSHLELAAIYSIDDRRDAPPHVESLSPRDGLLDLIANTYHNVRDSSLLPTNFERLGRIAAHVPLRLAVPNVRLHSVYDLADAIVDDVRNLRRDRDSGLRPATRIRRVHEGDAGSPATSPDAVR
jgi:hypothetical protein